MLARVLISDGDYAMQLPNSPRFIGTIQRLNRYFVDFINIETQIIFHLSAFGLNFLSCASSYKRLN